MGLLSLFGRETFSYYGSSSYRHVDKLISRERELLIISPYIDEYYANFLLDHSRGKSVYVLSSSIRQSAARRLRSSRLPGAMVLTFLVAFVNMLLLSFDRFSFLFALASSSMALAYLLSSLFSRRSIRLKTPREFVHAKMYVGDGVAIEGSANLTYSGMHRNIERISITRNEKRIAELKEEFWKLWNSV